MRVAWVSFMRVMPVRIIAASAAIVLVGVAASGCAGMRRADARAVDTTAAASPGPALVGTWKGLAIMPEYPGPADTTVVLTIRPDGTWQWGKSADDIRARGIVERATPDRVVLQAQQAKDAPEQRIQLQRSGDTLWGLSQAFIPGRPATVKLDKKVES